MKYKIVKTLLIFGFTVFITGELPAELVRGFKIKWGSYGSGDGQFIYPYGIAIDTSSYVYVADRNNNRIQVFTSTGGFIRKWGSSGSGDGQFSSPRAVAIDTSGYVYVAESGNDRIQVFTSTGGFIRKWGSLGSGDGQFSNPYGIAVDTSGYVCVADSYNDRIQVFTSTGGFIRKWGNNGSGDGQFKYPYGVAVDTSGYVYVVDNDNYRIQVFTSTGGFIRKWGSYGSGDGEFYSPYGLTIDTSGYVYITDNGSNRIQIFTSDGRFIEKFGSYGSDDGQFNSPYGVAVDSSGYVYVADSSNNRIQKFGFTNRPILSWTGEPGYEFDGIDPEMGYADTEFVFRIKYTDIDNEPPKTDYPKVHITNDWEWDISGSPFAMNYVSGNYDTGAIYSYSMIISTVDNYKHYFGAYDVCAAASTGTPTINGPVVMYQTDGIISGVVKDFEGNPVKNARIETEYPSPEYEYTYTNESGSYTLAGLTPGYYNLYCVPPLDVNLVKQKRTNVSVISGEFTTINFVLQLGCKIYGTVTDEESNPVEDAKITSFRSSYEDYGFAYSVATGIYSLVGLSTGTYTVKCDPPSGRPDLVSTSIADITVSTSVDTEVNIVLPPGGEVYGKVTDEQSTPLEDAMVRIEDARPYYYYDEYTYTVNTGTYAVSGIPTSTYNITCTPPSGMNLAQTKINNVFISTGMSIEYNFTLPPGGIISGKVTDEKGAPIEDARISASGEVSKYADSSSTGSYTIFGLCTGTYTVKCTPPYQSSYTWVTFENVQVTTGTSTELNFVLPVGGMLKGKVTDIENNPIYNVGVRAESSSGEEKYVSTVITGTYTIVGLAEGKYTVEFYRPSGSNFLSRKLSNVDIYNGKTTELDIVLIKGGVIMGKVTDEGSNPIYSASIDIVGPDSYYNYTDAQGEYIERGLMEGKYVVKCTPPSGTSFAMQTAETTVISGSTVTINFVLSEGGSISGTVKKGGLTPYPSFYAFAIPAEVKLNVTAPYLDISGSDISADLSGNYTIANLSEGYYDIYILSFMGSTVGNFVNRAFDIEVKKGTTTENVDIIESSAEGSISGKILSLEGAGVKDKSIIVIDNDTEEWAGFCVSFTDGNYTVEKLSAGTYTIYVEYYDPSNTDIELYSTVIVTLSEGETKENIDITLEKVSSDSGLIVVLDNLIRIEIPRDSFVSDAKIVASINPYTDEIREANSYLKEDQMSYALQDSVWEIKAVDPTDENKTVELKSGVKLKGTFPYSPSIDSETAGDSLRIYTLGSSKRWGVIPGTQTVDTAEYTVFCEIEHLSYFKLLFSAAAENIDDVIVYPNPYKPTKNPLHKMIIFYRLPRKVKIKIYNIAGELVRTLEKDNSEDRQEWYADNDEGEKIASGIYIYLVEDLDKGKKKTGKLAIIK